VSSSEPGLSTDALAMQVESKHDPYAALRFADFRLLVSGSFVASLGEQMVNVAIGWELYQRTRSALILGGVGLMLVLPVIIFSLYAGHVADRYDRRKLILLTQAMLVLGFLGLTILSAVQGSIPLIYACLFFIGTGAAFNQPAMATLTPQTVPASIYGNAATWSSSSWQMASVLGPTLGGAMIAVTSAATPVYAINTLMAVAFFILLAQMRARPKSATDAPEQSTVESLKEGFSFLIHTPVILAAITLDLFAVLLGGATTLLPIFASDILHVGPVGLGVLRAAPSIGALTVTLVLAYRPPFRRAGRVLLLSVAGFGAATIVFGFSHNIILSVITLVLLGGLDNVSVVIRGTLMLTRVPDVMRGRVSAVNGLFISSSNELGGFESGLAASLLGPVLAVAGGGIGTLIVVAFVAFTWPELRKMGRLYEPSE
jgi:MFS family permease